MKRKNLALTLALIGSFAFPLTSRSQKTVLRLPFEFERPRGANRDYNAYFLNNDQDSTFSLILQDNKKAQYVLVDKNFKITSSIIADRKTTVFNEDVTEYRGGTATGGIFRFIYEDKKAVGARHNPFQVETVDFNTKTVTHTKLFSIPINEKMLTSFSDNNMYFSITADDKTKEIAVYTVDQTGNFKTQRFPFNIPATTGKKRNDLSEYLTNLQLIKKGEEPDLSSAVSTAKLFSLPGKLLFVINDNDNPAHIFQIDVPAFTSSERFIDFGSFKSGGKDKINVNSFLRGDRLFSLILDKKTIRIATHDLINGNLQNKYEINESSSFGIFARFPVNETRMGKSADETDVNDIKQLIRSLERGTEGIMISENAKGQLIVTIGTYNLVPMRSGGSSGSYMPSTTSRTMSVAPGIMNHGATSATITTTRYVYIPGAPSYTTTSARYYTTTYFKLLFDPSATTIEKGKLGTPVPDQIKDYMEGADSKAYATNQFSIGSREFYGYYDKDALAYIVEEIKIRR